MSTKISYRLRGSPSQHTQFHLMTRLFEFRLVTIGVFHQKCFIMESKKKSVLSFFARQCCCPALECAAWLALPGQIWATVTITWDMRQEECDPGYAGFKLSHSLWEHCVMVTLIILILWPNHLSSAIFLILWCPLKHIVRLNTCKNANWYSQIIDIVGLEGWLCLSRKQSLGQMMNCMCSGH